MNAALSSHRCILCVCHDPFLRVHTSFHVCHDSFMWVHCDESRSSDDSFIWVPWLIPCVPWLVHVSARWRDAVLSDCFVARRTKFTQLCTYIYMWISWRIQYVSWLIHVSARSRFVVFWWLIHMSAMTHSYECHDSFIWVTWLIPCVPWLTHMCHDSVIWVTHSHVPRLTHMSARLRRVVLSL